jgi:hypothetical protein
VCTTAARAASGRRRPRDRTLLFVLDPVARAMRRRSPVIQVITVQSLRPCAGCLLRLPVLVRRLGTYVYTRSVKNGRMCGACHGSVRTAMLVTGLSERIVVGGVGDRRGLGGYGCADVNQGWLVMSGQAACC